MRTKLRALGRLLFSPSGTIGWLPYLLATTAIFLFKFPLDAWFAGHAGSTLAFESFWRSSAYDGLQFAIGWALGSPFGILAAPFAWTGLVLAAKRMRAIGWPPALIGLFFVPFVNYVVLGLLVASPDRDSQRGSHFPPSHRPFHSFQQAELGSSLRGALLGFLSVFAIVTSAEMVDSYRWFFILLTGPMLAGLFATVTYVPDDVSSHQGLSWVSMVAAAGYCFLCQFGFENSEGMICSIPIAGLFSLFGSLLGGLLIEWAKPPSMRRWTL